MGAPSETLLQNNLLAIFILMIGIGLVFSPTLPCWGYTEHHLAQTPPPTSNFLTAIPENDLRILAQQEVLAI